MWPFTRRGRDAPTRAQRDSSQARMNIHPMWSWITPGNFSLETSEAIFSAITRISNALATMPMKLYKGFDPDLVQPAARLVCYEPRPGMKPFTFFQTMEVCRNTAGNAYAFIVPSPVTGQAVALDIIDPSRVEPIRDRDSGELWYVMRPEEGEALYVHSRNMIHVQHVSTNGRKGVSPIKVLQGTLEYDQQMKEFSLFQLKGVNSSVVLEFPTNMGKVKRDEVVDGFLTQYRKSSGSLIVLESGVKAEVIVKSPVDGKVLESESVTRTRVACVYNMPPHMLGVVQQNMSYQSNEQQMLEFMMLTMEPIVSMYEQEFNLKLLSWDLFKQGYHFGMDMESAMRADAISQAKTNSLAVRGGWRLANEIRAREGRGPIPYGDTPMASRDMAPLKYLVENPSRGTEKGGNA